MTVSPWTIAENASFNVFANSYLAEVDSGCIIKGSAGNESILLQLQNSEQLLRIELIQASCFGPSKLGEAFSCRTPDNFSHTPSTTEYSSLQWRQADKLFLISLLVREIYAKQAERLKNNASLSKIEQGSLANGQIKAKESELLMRIHESYQAMATYLEARQGDSTLSSLSFIQSEQNILFGHWLHPTPKSKLGLAFWQQAHYSPELKGHFALHYFAVDQSIVTQASLFEKSTSDLIYDDLAPFLTSDEKRKVDALVDSGCALIPAHPTQAHYLLLQGEIRTLMSRSKIHYLGELGSEHTATSSVRTLYAEHLPWMYKFSIPVKITNSLRSNFKDELEDGMAVELFLREKGFFEQHPRFKMLEDPAYITVNLPSNPELESGFETILRRNFLYQSTEANSTCSILALVQEPVELNSNGEGKSALNKLIIELAERDQQTTETTALKWFEAYFKCSVEPLLSLYDDYGIALEAHQQNSLLDLESGYPKAYYYRDNQGFYVSTRYQETFDFIDSMRTMSDLIYDDENIFEAFSYYVFINQCFAVMHRLSIDNLISEETLKNWLIERLLVLQSQFNGIAKLYITHILAQPKIAFKTNLLTRVLDIDECSSDLEMDVYGTINNPIFVKSLTDKVDSKDLSANEVESIS